MKKILLFDIDGTLLHTGGCGKVAFEKAFQELFGISNAWGNTSPDGKTDPLIIEEIVATTLKHPLDKHEYQNLCERYLAYFEKEIKIAPRFRLMPGIIPLLTKLSEEKDVFLGIASGNFEEAAWLKLEAGKIRHFFKFGGFGSDSKERSEIIKTAIQRGEKACGYTFRKDQVYVIGDTIYDVRAAKKAGVKSIGVTTGTKGKDSFSEKPDYLLPDLSDTKRFLTIVNS